MKQTILCVLYLLVAGVAWAQSPAANEPADLKRLRESWQRARQQVDAPLDKKYADALIELMARLVKAGNLDQALLVDAEIKKVSPGASTEVADADADGQVVEIDAKTEGTSVGNLKAGQEIRLHYVEGTWTAYMAWAPNSPDDTKIGSNRLKVVGVTAKGKSATEVPLNTKRHTFIFRVVEDGEYFLRIADTVLDSNAGKVKYKVVISAAKS
jgi:hypothetical protein